MLIRIISRSMQGIPRKNVIASKGSVNDVFTLNDVDGRKLRVKF